MGTSLRCTRGSRGGSSTMPRLATSSTTHGWRGSSSGSPTATSTRVLSRRRRRNAGGAASTWPVIRSLLIVQHLLIAINAHVNFDLPQAVVQLVDDGAELAAIRPDFDAVNDILAATYDDLLGDLDRVTRWTGKAAARGGGWIFNFSLRAARDQAWRAAVRLSAEDDGDASRRHRPARRVGCRARVPRDTPLTTRAVARPAPSSARDARPSTSDDDIARPVGVKNPSCLLQTAVGFG